MLLAEAAGFDLVLVETVGVGQSETAVSEMVDLFVLLIGPGGGDELQGIKRGVMELADIVLVTKADGELKSAAARAASEYAHALHLMRPKYANFAPQVLQVSAIEGRGIAETWQAIWQFHEVLKTTGRLQKLRETQLKHWFRDEVQALIAEAVFSNRAVDREMESAEAEVVAGCRLPGSAARKLVGLYLTAQSGANSPGPSH
jgi:LAO/AO transport system kinase